jgi:hypothetical protein
VVNAPDTGGSSIRAAGSGRVRRALRTATSIRGRTTTCMLVAAALMTSTACSSSPGTEVAPTTTRPSTSTTPGMVVALPGTLAANFRDLLPALNGRAGIAIMAVGGDRPVVLGNWTDGPAWSTMKVPLSLAVLRGNGNTATYQMSAAITESDNTAADGLWQQLGTPDVAAQAVQAVLRAGGDIITRVPAAKPRPEYSAFGQADWALIDQVRFASRLPCLPNSDTVTDLMGRVVRGQQWGLGHLDNARYKGGWGPDPSGNYLVRQFGLVGTDAGQVAIALAAQANSGSYDEGIQMLNKMSALIAEHLGELPTGGCGGPH